MLLQEARPAPPSVPSRLCPLASGDGTLGALSLALHCPRWWRGLCRCQTGPGVESLMQVSTPPAPSLLLLASPSILLLFLPLFLLSFLPLSLSVSPPCGYRERGHHPWIGPYSPSLWARTGVPMPPAGRISGLQRARSPRNQTMVFISISLYGSFEGAPCG